jgi:hypothetical protein
VTPQVTAVDDRFGTHRTPRSTRSKIIRTLKDGKLIETGRQTSVIYDVAALLEIANVDRAASRRVVKRHG